MHSGVEVHVLHSGSEKPPKQLHSGANNYRSAHEQDAAALEAVVQKFPALHRTVSSCTGVTVPKLSVCAQVLRSTQRQPSLCAEVPCSTQKQPSLCAEVLCSEYKPPSLSAEVLHSARKQPNLCAEGSHSAQI